MSITVNASAIKDVTHVMQFTSEKLVQSNSEAVTAYWLELRKEYLESLAERYSTDTDTLIKAWAAWCVSAMKVGS